MGKKQNKTKKTQFIMLMCSSKINKDVQVIFSWIFLSILSYPLLQN